MKNFKTLITIIALGLTTVFSAAEKEPVKKANSETKTLRKEMSSYIGKNIPIEVKKTTTAEISFIINSKNEIVVLTVDSKESALNKYLKNKLNYKKVTTKGIKKGEVYKIPLKVNKK